MTLAQSRAQIRNQSTSHRRPRLCIISLCRGRELKALKSKHNRSESRCSMWRKICNRTNLWNNCAKMLTENLVLSCLIQGQSVVRATLNWLMQSISCTVTSCLTLQSVQLALGGPLVSKLKRLLGHHILYLKNSEKILILDWVPMNLSCRQHIRLASNKSKIHQLLGLNDENYTISAQVNDYKLSRWLAKEVYHMNKWLCGSISKNNSYLTSWKT